MKQLDRLILKSFIGPFILTTVVSTFILLIQYMLKYFDDFVGKDLGFNVFAELIFYFSLNMMPVALPLGVLLSSLMTFGNLGEHFELTAIKSSGISLLRALRSIFIFVIFLSFGAFHFNNIVVPAANLKAYSLLFDIRQKKPGLDIREGQFYDGIDGYSIKVKEKLPDNKTLKEVVIYDHTDKLKRGNNRVILADSSIMYTFLNDRYLKFELFNGNYYSEIPKGRTSKREYNQFIRNRFDKMEMVFSLAGFDMNKTKEDLFKNNRQMKNITELTADIDSLQREIDNQRRQNLYTTLGYYEFFKAGLLKQMRDSVNQMMQDKYNNDSLRVNKDSLGISKRISFHVPNTEMNQASILSFLSFQQDSSKFKLLKEKSLNRKKVLREPSVGKLTPQLRKTIEESKLDSSENKLEVKSQFKIPDNQNLRPSLSETGDIVGIDSTDREKSNFVLDTTLVAKTQESLDEYFAESLGSRSSVMSGALANARNIKNSYANSKTRIRGFQKTKYRFIIEKHKKYSQAFACIVMFLIGAPLGAIIKRGGLGVPVIVSIFFFILYYVLTITSHKQAKEGFIDGRIAVWISDIVLLPIGLYFLNRARVDARIFELDIYYIWFDKMKQKWFGKKAAT